MGHKLRHSPSLRWPAGPGRRVCPLTLAAGDGITAALSPIQMLHRFQIEFVCFPSRLGVPGMVDRAKDKVEELRDGSQHESYVGDSFFVLSPVIAPMAEHKKGM